MVVFFVSSFFNQLSAQNVGINFNGAAPNASAAFDVDVTALAGQKKGLLMPRVTLAERMAMSPLLTPAQGLMVYQTNDAEGFYYNTSTTNIPTWVTLQNNNLIRYDQLLNPSASKLLSFGGNRALFTFEGLTTNSAFNLSSETITSGVLLNINSSSAAGVASANTEMLKIYRGGISVNADHRAIGVSSKIDHQGPNSSNYGGYYDVSGATINYGVFSIVRSGQGFGIRTTNNSTDEGNQYGVFSQKIGNLINSDGFAVAGSALGTAANNYGGQFTAAGGNTNFGVFARIFDKVGYGVYGQNSSGDVGTQYGMYGEKTGTNAFGIGYGVFGRAINDGAANFGGRFEASGATQNTGVSATVDGNGYAITATATGTGQGIYAETVGGAAMWGRKNGNGGSGNIGVKGEAIGASSINTGGFFLASGATNNYALVVPSAGGRVSFGSVSSVTDAVLSINDGHFQAQAPFEPTIQANVNAGILAGSAISSISSDVAGSFSITGGSGILNAGLQATITFRKAYTYSPIVILTPTNSSAAAKAVYVTANTTSFSLFFTSPGATNITYSFNYMVIEN